MKSITQVVENLLKPYIDEKDRNIYKVMGKMGAKALLPMSLADIKARHSTGTWNGNAYTINGITYTINTDSDGFITDIVVTGTASADATLTVYGYSYTSDYAKVFDVPVIASTDFVGSDSTARGIIWGSNSGYIDGTELQIAAGTIYGFGLRVVNGYEIPEGGITFKPMLRFASDTDSTYQPYAKTNKELTAENGALTNEIDKAYQTDDAAITEVASDDLLPIYDTSAAAKKKIAVNNFIGGLISNPNLLDNPWFTINQRGFTSASNPSAGTHVVDRWAVRYNPSSGDVAVNDNIVTLTSNGGLLIIGERFEENVGFSGKTMTASIMLSDGTIYSGTGVFPSKNGADKIVITTDDFNVYFQYSSGSANYPMLAITCKANKTLAIKAVKLELGSVSTLAMDTAPNYAEELLKCQRYYFAPSSCNPVGSITNSTTAFISYITPTKMRATPTIGSIYGGLIFNGKSKLITDAEIAAVRNNSIYVKVTGSEFDTGHVCVLQNSSLTFSADL